MFTRKLRESVVRAEIALLQRRIDALPTMHPRVARFQTRYIKQDFAKLDALARKWGLL